VSRKYVPDRGDLVWLDFDPRRGHEQSGHRPAFVLSPKSYNGKVGLALCCPVTSQVKGYPFESVLPAGLPLGGAILADQVKSLDWRERQAKHICAAPDDVIEDVQAKVIALVGH
jgi:mRNA interferase MazF